jgi:hypothetical protein
MELDRNGEETMTEMTAVKSPADLLAEGGPTTAHKLAATLLAGPDLPVVMAVGGPDAEWHSLLVFAEVASYYPESAWHGTVRGLREDPDAVTAVALHQAGVPDEAR